MGNGGRTETVQPRGRELAEAFVKARAAHMGDQPGEATRDELIRRARNAGVGGVGAMSKDELKKALSSD